MKNKQLIFGTRAVIEAVNSDKNVDKVLIKKGLPNSLISELLNLLKSRNVPFQFVPIEKINGISTGNHQGVLAFLSEIKYQNIEHLVPFWFESGVNPIVLVLDGITDVRNFGAIARTAECAGVSAIVVPDKGSAQINADAVKTSAGALLKIPVCRHDSLINVVKFLKNSGFATFAATEKAEKSYTKADFSAPLTLVLGSEDIGISKELLAVTDVWIKIPIFGEIQSLNVSVAAGIMLYEAVKQRTT